MYYDMVSVINVHCDIDVMWFIHISMCIIQLSHCHTLLYCTAQCIVILVVYIHVHVCVCYNIPMSGISDL